MNNYYVIVTVAALVEAFDLDPLDNEIEGTYHISVEADTIDEAVDAALEEFHLTYPIAVLDDFDISTEIRMKGFARA